MVNLILVLRPTTGPFREHHSFSFILPKVKWNLCYGGWGAGSTPMPKCPTPHRHWTLLFRAPKFHGGRGRLSATHDGPWAAGPHPWEGSTPHRIVRLKNFGIPCMRSLVHGQVGISLKLIPLKLRHCSFPFGKPCVDQRSRWRGHPSPTQTILSISVLFSTRG